MTAVAPMMGIDGRFAWIPSLDVGRAYAEVECMEMIVDWITPGAVIAATGVLLRYLRILEKRLNRVDARFDRIDERFDRIDERFERIDERFERQDARIAERFERQDARIDLRFDALSREVAANGKVIARLVGLHEVHPEHRPVAVAE